MPAIRALTSWRPDAHLTFAGHAGAAGLLEETGEVDEGRGFDDPSLAWLFGAEQTRDAATPEVVVAWLDDSSGRLAARLRRAGVARSAIAASRPSEASGHHCATHLLETIAPLTGRRALDDRVLSLRPAPCDEVLIHPGSGAPRKNWPAERFAAVVRALRARGKGVRLIVGEADAESAAGVEGSLGSRLPRMESPSLADLGSALAGSRAYLGNDSGVSHLAGLSGAHCVVVFGPTRSSTWLPLGPRVTAVEFTADPVEVAGLLAGAG